MTAATVVVRRAKQPDAEQINHSSHLVFDGMTRGLSKIYPATTIRESELPVFT